MALSNKKPPRVKAPRGLVFYLKLNRYCILYSTISVITMANIHYFTDKKNCKIQVNEDCNQ